MQSLETDAILFDLDGVLVDSTPCVTRVWTNWALERGYQPSEVVRIAHGRRAIETVQIVAPHLDSAAELREIERRELADMDGLVVIPGAADLLDSLPPDRWAIVTSGTRALATARLQAAGLPVPRRMVTADDVSLGKPHPAPYLAGADLLSLPPAACVVVEDAPSGVRAATAAGMRSFAIPTTYPAAELHEATVLLHALLQLRVTHNGDRSLKLRW
jgi:sugar-phosphatase